MNLTFEDMLTDIDFIKEKLFEYKNAFKAGIESVSTTFNSSFLNTYSHQINKDQSNKLIDISLTDMNNTYQSFLFDFTKLEEKLESISKSIQELRLNRMTINPYNFLVNKNNNIEIIGKSKCYLNNYNEFIDINLIELAHKYILFTLEKNFRCNIENDFITGLNLIYSLFLREIYQKINTGCFKKDLKILSSNNSTLTTIFPEIESLLKNQTLCTGSQLEQLNTLQKENQKLKEKNISIHKFIEQKKGYKFELYKLKDQIQSNKKCVLNLFNHIWSFKNNLCQNFLKSQIKSDYISELRNLKFDVSTQTIDFYDSEFTKNKNFDDKYFKRNINKICLNNVNTCSSDCTNSLDYIFDYISKEKLEELAGQYLTNKYLYYQKKVNEVLLENKSLEVKIKTKNRNIRELKEYYRINLNRLETPASIKSSQKKKLNDLEDTFTQLDVFHSDSELLTLHQKTIDIEKKQFEIQIRKKNAENEINTVISKLEFNLEQWTKADDKTMGPDGKSKDEIISRINLEIQTNRYKLTQLNLSLEKFYYQLTTKQNEIMHRISLILENKNKAYISNKNNNSIN